MSALVEQITNDIKAAMKAGEKETGAASKKDMGKVMGALMPDIKGKAGNALVSRMVSQALSGQAG